MRRLAEWALLVLAIATVAGFGRLFTDGSFLPLLLVVVYAHVAASLCRRAGLGVGRAALACLVGLLPVLTCLFYWEQSTLGLPGPAVVDAARQSLSEAWALFSDVQAPAPPATGFLLATAVAFAVSAFLADWAAFRLWSPWEAIVPYTTLFVFGALLGREGQVAAASLFLAGCLVFLLLHRVERLEEGAWVGQPTAARSSLIGHGLLLALVAVVAGTVIGPATPGADAPALVEYRGGDDRDGDRVTVSPLVDIQNRLTEQDDAVLFRVVADQPAYWRLTSLDIFDGEIWKSKGRYRGASGELPEGPDSEADTSLVSQEYTIEALAALWLPAAYEPRVLESEIDVRYEPRSGTLIVETDEVSSDGYQYSVESAVPSFTAEQLSAAPAPAAEVLDEYAVPPPGISDFAASWASQTTAGATNDYQRALLLQDRFRGGEFTYSLTVPRGHDGSAIDQFLRDRAGYCEQFAGTFAALARSLGMPARVAVGFTPGTEEESAGTYVVRGKYAHAWPEVWFEGYGWVPFEPTPGRGMPAAAAWTGVEQAQADDAAGEPGTTTSTSAPGPTVAPPTTEAPAFDDLLTTPETSTGASEQADGGGQTPLVVRVLLGLGALVLVYLLVVPALLAIRQSRRRAAATEPRARVLLAWDETLEALDATRRPDETYAEFARRAGSRLGDEATDLAVLAEQTTAADYWQVDEQAAGDAEQASIAVIARVRDREATRDRVVRHLDARRLVPRRRGTGR